MGSVAILCKLRNGNAYSSMPHWVVLQHTMDSKGGSGELHKGGDKASSPRALTFGSADPARNAKGAAREILKRKTNSVTAGAKRRQRELRGGADTNLAIDMSA